MRIDGREMAVEGRLLKTVRLDDEWHEDFGDPTSFLEAVPSSNLKADLFTFWQRFPDTTPRFDYAIEWEDLAVLPIRSFDEWWNTGIKSRTRGLIRKSEKMGAKILEVDFNDDFVRGMVDIFNETPIRQGRRFPHYGKNFETVKNEFSRYLFRETVIGAYHEGKLIGFVMLANAGRYAILRQIISKVEHRDKSPNNALIAKAVELTAKKQIPYLVYNYWNETGFTEFKRRNGFEKQSVPRYYLPLTAKGRLGLALGLHKPLNKLLPSKVVSHLRTVRASFYGCWYSSSSVATGDI